MNNNYRGETGFMAAEINYHNNDIIEIARNCAMVLDEKKALNSILIDLRKINSYFDYFLITTGNSHIHCKSLAKDLRKFLISSGLKERNIPGTDSGWIVLDFSEIIVHIFTEEMKEYYQLDKLWADADTISY